MPRTLFTAVIAALLTSTAPMAVPAAAAVSDAPHHDLKPTLTGTQARPVTVQTATAIETALRTLLRDRFAGAWVAADGRTVAAVTDRAAIPIARAAGAHPTLVTWSESALRAYAERLDRAAVHVPEGITSWYVDVQRNAVVIEVVPGRATAAIDFAIRAGADPEAVQTRTVPHLPRTVSYVRGGGPDQTQQALSDLPQAASYVRGGDRYQTAVGTQCAVGFTVAGGFLTPGHCGRPGDLVYSLNGELLGTFTAVSFPGNDYGLVRLAPGWTPLGQVNGPTGPFDVLGSQEAPVGAMVCLYGSSSSGLHCGTVQAKNVTIAYPQGVVYGLTRTNVCVDPGYSGESLMWGHQAQGILSGASGTCSSGGSSFFQPVREPLAAYGLILLTS